MAKNNDKGKLLEKIVAAFHKDKNIKVELNKKINGREIDILLTFIVAGYLKQCIPIECKNHKNKVGVKEIDAYRGKLDNIGLSKESAIFVSTNGFTSGARKTAKEIGIKLLVLNGLAKDGLSKSLYKAIQSVIYILPIFTKYKVTSSIQEASNNEHLIFYDKNKNFIGTLADLIYSIWIDNKISLTLGIHKFRVNVPNDWFNLYKDELHTCFHIEIELTFIGYVILYYGTVHHLDLVEEETNNILKSDINFDFSHIRKSSIKTFKDENELEDFLKQREESYKIDIERIKLPKVRMNDLFYPVSEKIQNEFKKFYSKTNKSKKEVESFTNKIKNMESDVSAVWEK